MLNIQGRFAMVEHAEANMGWQKAGWPRDPGEALCSYSPSDRRAPAVVPSSLWEAIGLPAGEASDIRVCGDEITEATARCYAATVRTTLARYARALGHFPGKSSLAMLPATTPAWAKPADDDGRHSPRTHLPGSMTPLPAPVGPISIFALHCLYCQLPGLARSTVRQYRAALTATLVLIPGADAGRAALILTFSRGLYSGERRTENTGVKFKGLPDRDLERLEEHFLGDRKGAWRKSELGALVVMWLHAGRLAGLRPVEWRQAELRYERVAPPGREAAPDQDEAGACVPILAVVNAKATHGRSCGVAREISLEEYTDEEVDLIRQFLRLTRPHATSEEAWAKFEQSCARTLRRAVSKIWPSRKKKRVTLYSGRHAMAIRAKQVHGKREVAALMGHASPETAGHHYGLRRNVAAGGLRLVVSNDADSAAARPRAPKPFGDAITRVQSPTPELDSPAIRAANAAVMDHAREGRGQSLPAFEHAKPAASPTHEN